MIIIIMLVLITTTFAAIGSGCSSDTETKESRTEHDAEGEHDEVSEESGDLLSLNDTYDVIRNGTRLIL